MFKRQFYALEHSNRGDSASSSSSSSLATASDGEGGRDVEDEGAWPASSHESDASAEEAVVEEEGATSAQWILGDEPKDVVDGSDNDADGDTSDIEPRERQRKKNLSNQWAEAVDDDESERVLQKFEGSSVICVGESNKVFKCRVCPKVVCLSEESMEAHLASKGHARSLKQLAEGRLKVQLDSDGEEEEEGETHAERFARTITTAQEEKAVKRKRDSGRQRQRKRMKRKALSAAKEGKSAPKLPLVSQRTAAQQLERKVLGTLKRKTSSQLAVPSVATSGSKGNKSLGKHLPPTSQKKNASFKTRTDRTSKAKHRK